MFLARYLTHIVQSITNIKKEITMNFFRTDSMIHVDMLNLGLSGGVHTHNNNNLLDSRGYTTGYNNDHGTVKTYSGYDTSWEVDKFNNLTAPKITEPISYDFTLNHRDDYERDRCKYNFAKPINYLDYQSKEKDFWFDY